MNDLESNIDYKIGYIRFCVALSMGSITLRVISEKKFSSKRKHAHKRSYSSFKFQSKKKGLHPLTYISKYVYYYYATLLCVYIKFVFLLKTTLNMTCSLHVNNVLVRIRMCVVYECLCMCV